MKTIKAPFAARAPTWLARVESPRVSTRCFEALLNHTCEWVRAAEGRAARSVPFLERRHGLADRSVAVAPRRAKPRSGRITGLFAQLAMRVLRAWGRTRCWVSYRGASRGPQGSFAFASRYGVSYGTLVNYAVSSAVHSLVLAACAH